MIINTYEKGERGRACAELLREMGGFISAGRVTVLPIPTTRDGVHLKDSDVTLTDACAEVGSGDVVIGYGIPSNIAGAVACAGGRVYDAGCDEWFLEKNAELTAECTLGILLSSSGGRALRDMTFGVVGYGRIGKRLSRLLLFLGARVRVFTTREEVRLELCEYGLGAEISSPTASLDGIDVLINTAPAVIFNEASDFPKAMRIIDLASGKNFPWLDSVESYPSIPARMFPTSSGRTLAEAALRSLRGE